MESIETALVRKQEYALWEAAGRQDRALMNRYVQGDAIVVCNSFRCSGEEYILALPSVKRFSMDKYETVSVSPNRIQNYYLVTMKPEKSNEIRICQASSTWTHTESGWKLIFHMQMIFKEREL